MKQLVFIVLMSVLLLGCASEPEIAEPKQATVFNKATVSERTLHSFAKQLAVTMFDSMPKLNADNRIAVGTFLPESDLENQQNDQLLTLGNQVQSSLQTLYTQVGANVIEFKASEHINIADKQDIMLSRKHSDLASELAVNYFLTGTISQVENGFIVNARLIDLSDKRVVSAATEMFPANINWQKNKVVLRDGKLYRSNY
ncbi:FlgO family outer membrane protein [Pseudoalteromonas sp.]|uniref:FlgO family outer membrane protein n=1 Tax=Pseudoalteromonas sp. TaxID=53249 RepID=UPI0035643D47